MQCPRCYYTNAAGTNVCEYCGARLGTDAPVQNGGAASSKRKTVLGPVPSASAPPPMPTRTSRIDPRDPFRIAAEGIPEPVVEPPPKPPPAPSAPPMEAPKPPSRPTLLTQQNPASQAPLVGVALILDADGARPVVLREGRVRIGRRADVELVVSDPTASSEHALLRIQGESAWLLDTSSNGTRVGDALCLNDRASVSDGSVLAIGETRIVIKLLSSDTLAQIDAGDP